MNEVATGTLVNNEEKQLPAPVMRRGITEAQWRTLKNSLFPGAKSESVIAVVDYCRARQLDPLKKPCHIVPMKVKDMISGEYVWRDVILPGIYEHRTTAARTGQYLGHHEPKYGPVVEAYGVTVPEWCAFTVLRWNPLAGRVCEFPVLIYFEEAVAIKDGKANQRWSRAPRQMLTKCAEAAALREAFPDELGGEMTAEEAEDPGTPEAAKKIGPRNTPSPDFELRDNWVSRIADTLAQDKTEFEIADDLRAIDAELQPFDALYTDVLDELSVRKIIAKGKFKEYLRLERKKEAT